MKEKLLSIFSISVIIIGVVFSIKLTNDKYFGDIIMNLLGLSFSKMITVIIVLVALFMGQKYTKDLPRYNSILRIAFTLLVLVSVITNAMF